MSRMLFIAGLKQGLRWRACRSPTICSTSFERSRSVPRWPNFVSVCTSVERSRSLSTLAGCCARSVRRDDRAGCLSGRRLGTSNASRTTHRGTYLRAQGHPAHCSFARRGVCSGPSASRTRGDAGTQTSRGGDGRSDRGSYYTVCPCVAAESDLEAETESECL